MSSKKVLYFVSTIVAFALIVGTTLVCLAADNTMVDPSSLPRLAGAQPNLSRTSTGSFVYSVPGSVPATDAATRKLLAADGWTQFAPPLEEPRGNPYFKKGPLGLYVYFTMHEGKADQSSVNYVATRISVDVPLPDSATDVIYDFNRPYLNCTAPGNVDAMLAFYDKNLAASGWSRLSAVDAASRWPNAKLADAIENGKLAYYTRANQRPIELSLRGRDGGKVSVEVKVASFALTQDLEAGPESFGLPKPKEIKSASATNGKTRKEMKVLVPAEVATVLAFYRREFALRNWKEGERNAVVNANEAAVMFASEEGRASLRLTRQYDLTIANLVIQVSEAVLAAQEKAKREENEKFIRDAQELARAAIAGDNERRAKAEALAATQPVQSLRARTDNNAPIPLPEDAADVKFEAGDGQLEYSSPSSVKTLAAFHRAALKELGWKEQPSVINNATMVVMDFAKGKQKFSMTMMQMGPKVRVSADGEGLKSKEPVVSASASAQANEDLEADADASGLPVPKKHTMSSQGTVTMQTGKGMFRRELNASVPANVESVLAFYRRELGKRGWKEGKQDGDAKADRVALAFSSPEGPATLKLGRSQGETSIVLSLKNPAEAQKAGLLPAAGQAKLILGNMGNNDVTVAINDKTIKVGAGVGGAKTPDGPMIDLRPGKYKYSVKAAGRPAHTGEIEVGADDAWGMIVAPAGNDALTMQLY